jgi:hypothetical protein
VLCLWSDQSAFMVVMVFNWWIGTGFIFEPLLNFLIAIFLFLPLDYISSLFPGCPVTENSSI